jgi:hypothetical protein
VVTAEGEEAARGQGELGEGTITLGVGGGVMSDVAGVGREVLPFVQGSSEEVARRIEASAGPPGATAALSPEAMAARALFGVTAVPARRRPGSTTLPLPVEPEKDALPFIKAAGAPLPAASKAITRAAPEPIAELDDDGWEEPEADPAQVSIERFATISAEIAEERAPRAEVLKKQALTLRAWEEVVRHHTRALEEEADRGASDLRRASDSAYVAAVEGFRGPITLSEYARIVVGVERGQRDRVLDELKIQRPALMPILRLWMKKAASDAKLAGEATAAIAAARGKKR